MPALIPLHNILGALFIGTVLSSIVYGVTWLQVYSYYSGHCSKDRWPLKSFVAFLMLVDTVNLVFCIYVTYLAGVTNFGDYQSILTDPWGQSAISLSAIVLGTFVQHFYAYRIYRLGGGSPYLPAAISVTSLTEFGLGLVYSVKILMHVHDPDPGSFEGFLIATLTPNVPCDILITAGMVYRLLSSRTHVRRTNNVLNLLAIYSINCGTLHLVSVIASITLLAKYPDTLLYIPTLFIMFRLSLCAFMAILNSRNYLRETLNGPRGVVSFTQLKVRTGTPVPWSAQDTTAAGASTDVPKSLPPAFVSSDTSFSDGVIAFDREKYPAPPVARLGSTSSVEKSDTVYERTGEQ